MAWVIGEYGYTVGEERLPQMATKLCQLADRPDSTAVTKSYVVGSSLDRVAVTHPPTHWRDRKRTVARGERCFVVVGGGVAGLLVPNSMLCCSWPGL